MSELHISDGENLIKNPNEEWGAVLKFLGLKRIEFNYEKNITENFDTKWAYFDLKLYLTVTVRDDYTPHDTRWQCTAKNLGPRYLL